MTKQVRETAAGQSISATVVLNKKGEHVATVQAHYSNAGRVTVDVWSTSVGLEGMCKRPDLWAKLPTDKDYKAGAFDLWSLQQGSAGGYGYDKHAAALAGLIIDGHTIADHCGQVPEAEGARAALLRAYWKAVKAGKANTTETRDEWRKKAERIGCRFANWRQDADGCEGWSSLHFDQGLTRLESLGYTVIQAI